MTVLETASLSAISLFSGAGGMDVGFKNAGFNVVMANDVDPDACATYRINHGDMIFEGDLRHLVPLSRHIGSVDLVFGGPPCQGFSVAGKMDPDDERSELIDTYMDVVDNVQPKVFVCENVKALAVLDRWKEVRERLLERGRRYYSVALVVLNSHDFGVPQGRERMFLVGVHKGHANITDGMLENHLVQTLEHLKTKPPALGDIIRKLGRAGSPTNSRTCKAKITFAKSPVMRKSPYAGMIFNGAGRPLPASGRSSTLPASMGGNKTPIVDEGEIFDAQPSFVEKYHASLVSGATPMSGEAPSRLRRLTVDECLAIQTFPESYVLYGSQSAMYRQIGNAVPCKLAEAVARVTAEIIGKPEILHSPVQQAAE